MSKENDKPRSLAKGSFIYGIGNIGTLVINFFLVPLYTFYLSNEELGYFDLVASGLILMAPVFFGHIELAVVRWVLANKNTKNVTDVVSNALVVFLAGLCLFTLVFGLVNAFSNVTLAKYVFVYLISNFFYIIVKQVIRSVFSSTHYVLTELSYVLMVLLCSIFFVGNYGLKAIFLSYGSASIVLLVYVLAMGITKYISFNTMKMTITKELLGYSFPLVLNAISLWMNNQSSKYIIASFLTLSANGIYAIAFKIAYVIQILNRIFYFSLQDKMFAVYGKAEFKDFFSKTFNTYSGLLFSLLYLLIAVQKVLLPLIIDTSFLEATRYIPILALGVVFMSLSSVLGIIYQCEKKNMHAFKTSLVSGILIVFMGFVLIPDYGLYGAALVFMIGNFIWLLYRYIDIQRYTVVKVKMLFFLMYIATAFVLFLITNNEGIWYIVLGIVVAVSASVLFNRELLRTKLSAMRKFF
ncbi:lipopolysaccharide biosynthesis protein [Maribacter sp. 2-571]|uniref:lipopolysaccharide biosynthesis protein n=1 Tax=Maribacter sp. 2-571 TaxID=3417569 RepID=UPI003D332D8D